MPPRSPPRNWTSLDLAKPQWEEVGSSQCFFPKTNICNGILLLQEEDKDGEISLKDYKEGQVQQLDMEEVANRIQKFPIKHFSLSGRGSRWWQGDLWNMGPVFESFAGHVKEH